MYPQGTVNKCVEKKRWNELLTELSTLSTVTKLWIQSIKIVNIKQKSTLNRIAWENILMLWCG